MHQVVDNQHVEDSLDLYDMNPIMGYEVVSRLGVVRSL